MAWGDNETYFDEIEWANIDWIRANLPSYIEYHAASHGHLPQNFLQKGSGAPLVRTDVASEFIRRVGYLSYSILVNILLAKEAEASRSDGDSMLPVYSRVSAFFLRGGAVIDIAKELWNTSQRTVAKKKVKGLNGPASKLKKALDPIDAFNNFTKHGGLTPSGVLRAEFDGETGHIILLPKALSRSAQDWGDHGEVDQDADDLLAAYLKKLVAESEKFYAALLKDNPRRLSGLGVTPTAGSKGVRDVLGAQNDGYVIVSAVNYASGNLGSSP